MTPELRYLALSAALTALLALPYLMDRILIRGILDAVGYPANPKPQSPWAQRLMKAHANAVENLAVFAALILVARAANLSNPMLQTAAAVYFWARVVHPIAYALAIPWLRTLAYIACYAAQLFIAQQIIFQ